MMSVWKTFFIYDPQNPMIFSNPVFWVFFGLALLIYQGIYQQNSWRNLFLLSFSIFFYYKTGGLFFFLILFSTVVDYFIGQWVHTSKDQAHRTALLVLSLVINLGLLSYFKYTYFFADLVNQAFQADLKVYDYLAAWSNQWWGTEFDISKIILPVGISFYTFQTLSYTIDIYRRKIEPVDHILDFAFYVSFFPQLVAGPIVRAADFTPQIYQPYQLSQEEFGRGIFLIINGLVKKILISDYISVNFVDRVFQDPNAYSGFENLMAVYGYAIQIYCDFSGYTDIAIGLALLLGFRLNINFNSPYVATSITDFWRRWHISLSTWLRDYLYISLGGNRSTSLFTYMSVPIVFVILLLAEGWHWAYFVFFFGIIGLWWLSLAYSKVPVFAYLGLSALFVLALEAFRLGHWYIFVITPVALLFWIIYIVNPASKRSLSTYINLLITMLLGGLWHGAALRFIIWGALHGAALAVHKFWMDRLGTKGVEMLGARRFLGQLITFHFVCYCWIYFRATDLLKVNQMLTQISTSFQFQVIPQVLLGYQEVFILMLSAYMIHWLPRSFKEEIIQYFISIPDLAKAVVIALVVVGLYQARTAGIQPFIYFQF